MIFLYFGGKVEVGIVWGIFVFRLSTETLSYKR